MVRTNYANEDVAVANSVQALGDLVNPQSLAVFFRTATFVLSLKQILFHLFQITVISS